MFTCKQILIVKCQLTLELQLTTILNLYKLANCTVFSYLIVTVETKEDKSRVVCVCVFFKSNCCKYNHLL